MLQELALLFLKLGCIGFGGPAAHLALMEDEVVRRRRWLTHQEFADLLGATALLPGPNSTQMALQIGRLRAGLPGLFVAGACFIGPAVITTAALAWAYVKYGALPAANAILAGVKPAVLGLIAAALVRLAPVAVRGAFMAAVALAALLASLLGAPALAVLAACAALGLALRASRQGSALFVIPLAAAAPAAASLASLSLFFLWVGSVLYGSGYVLLAYLRSGLVVERGWITERQLLDAISVGQVTPGPLSSTATFIGWLLLGPLGAAAATLAIFAPSFLLVAVTGPWIPKLRASKAFGGLLDGANAGSMGLLAAVIVQLGKDALTGPLQFAVSLIALGLAWRTKLNATWLLLGGAVIGLVWRGR